MASYYLSFNIDAVEIKRSRRFMWDKLIVSMPFKLGELQQAIGEAKIVLALLENKGAYLQTDAEAPKV